MNSKVLRYSDDDSTVTYDIKRCIHAGECAKGLPQVFDPSKKPWVDPSQASSDELLETIERCPTGALHLEGGEERPPLTPEIRVRADGQLELRGRIKLQTIEGETLLEDTRVALCRCGASSNKPLCDNSHGEDSFSDPAALGSLPTAEATVGAGELAVRAAPNGPLLLDGPFTLKGEDGSELKGTKAALCRCGGSSNKPFCDGTHGKIGFTPD